MNILILVISIIDLITSFHLVVPKTTNLYPQLQRGGIEEHILNAGNISSGTLCEGWMVVKEEIKHLWMNELRINIKKKNFPLSLMTILARAITLYGDWKGTLIFQDFRRAKASLIGSTLICDCRICYCRSRRCTKYAGIIEGRGYSAHKILILTGQDYLDTRIYAAEQTAVSAHETAKDRLILLPSGNANRHFKLHQF